MRRWSLQMAVAFIASIPLGYAFAWLLVSTFLASCRTYDLMPYPRICEFGTLFIYGGWLMIFASLLWFLPFRKA